MPRLAITQVTDRVFCVQRSRYLSCSYFVRGNDGIVLIDSGMDRHGADMEAGLRSIGARIEDISAILLTHWHNDHASGAPRIQERSGAAVYHHPSAGPKLRGEQRARGLRGCIVRITPEIGPFAPLRGLLDSSPPVALQQGTTCSEGDVLCDEFEVLETPGHEAGHLSFHFRSENVLFAGDALAVAKDHVSYMSRVLTADVEQARSSMIRCLELGADHLCPGHRYPLSQPDQAMVRATIERTQKLRRWPIYGC